MRASLRGGRRARRADALRSSLRRKTRRFGAPEGEIEGRFTSPYNLTGAPAISLPCGLAESDLPAGLQLAAAVNEDELLLSVAREYERVTR